ncbi:hypothetical protein HaLaN_24605, partial [Haematococcus lacustris]
MKQKRPHMPGARAAALRCRLIMAQQDGLLKTLQTHSRQVLELQMLRSQDPYTYPAHPYTPMSLLYT